MLFGLIALLTGAAVFAVLWPLARKPDPQNVGSAPDVAFYKAKLDEIAREAESELLSPPEAEAARTEAARRLLKAADESVPHKPLAPKTGVSAGAAQLRVRLVALAALIVIPALSLGLYAVLGHPSWPDAPLSARLDVPPEKLSLAAAIAKVEVHLLHDPNDGRGYEVLVPAYLNVGRLDDAAHAADMAMQLLGATPERKTIYGETLVFAAHGVVTEMARKLFAEAAAANPPELKAMYFLGLAAAQDGDKKAAASEWQALLSKLPKGEPFASDVEARLAALQGQAPPSDEAAAIAGMAPEQRAAAIHGMIDRLAARLAQNGHDIEGWLRLVRAYKVTNEIDKARAALATARKDFSGDAEATARLDALAHELGLES
ncbi:MAG: c-type cytochrome biogenesis protein CcmI [Methylovirgula sp.]|jgi:cytochrome c-type biogenesis protein CcmH